MSARQSFVPRSASRASTHADTEHPFDMSLRNQNSLGQPQRTGGNQNELDSVQPKTDSEKKARFSGLIGKKFAGKLGSGDHPAAIDASFSSASGRFSGIYRPDIQSLAIPRRSSSPFRGKGSPFSPMAKSASHRGDLTISGLKDAHISTPGVSGLISTSRVIAAPVPSYGSIHDGRHDDEHTFSSNKSSLAKESTEDVEPETANEDEALLDARRTNVVAHPVLRRVKRTIQGTQEDEAGFSPPDEIGYMRRVKRVKIDEFPCELEDSRPDDTSHSGIDHTQLQPDLDDDTARQSSASTGQTGAGAAEEISLDGMFANMDSFLDVDTYIGPHSEVWLQGSEEIVEQFKDIIDSVKENLTANVTLYSRLDDQVRDRREEQAQLTEHLRRGLGSARTESDRYLPGEVN
ncbi:hypothetical protein EV424DRAFT_1399505 [Suillus variegatus]|nr:hypothetical protein EV424DRAFT_1399505 [Suillus variegatus]